MDPDPGGQKHTDPADPDPQHWLTTGGSQCARNVQLQSPMKRRGMQSKAEVKEILQKMIFHHVIKWLLLIL